MKRFSGSKKAYNLDLLHGKNDLPSVKEFVEQHTKQSLNYQKMFTTDPKTSNIAQIVFTNYGMKDSDFFEYNVFNQPKKLPKECGSMKVLISDISDFPQYKEEYEKHVGENRILCIGGPAAEDQVVLAHIIDGVREKLDTIPGTPPSLLNIPQGCAFNPRCSYQKWVGEKCLIQKPELISVGNGFSACYLSKADIDRMNNDDKPVVS